MIDQNSELEFFFLLEECREPHDKTPDSLPKVYRKSGVHKKTSYATSSNQIQQKIPMFSQGTCVIFRMLDFVSAISSFTQKMSRRRPSKEGTQVHSAQSSI